MYADGSKDARDSEELSVQQRFFPLQDPLPKKFVLKLNVTQGVFDGRKTVFAYGTAYINIFINDPPENGTCDITVLDGQDADGGDVWKPAKTGMALLDIFHIGCQDWVDPNDHTITKYVFKREFIH